MSVRKDKKKWGERMILFCVLLQSLHGNMLNPLNAELNTICHLLTLLAAHHILHVSRIRVKQTHFVAEVQYFYGERISCN